MMDPLLASNGGTSLRRPRLARPGRSAGSAPSPLTIAAVLSGDLERIEAVRKTRSAGNIHTLTPFPITIVGKSQVGKSALAVRFLYELYLEDYVATELNHFLEEILFDGETVVLDVLDTSGAGVTYNQEDLYKSSDGFLCVFSLTDEESFAAVEHYWREIREVKGSSWTPFILLGNKKDSEDRLASLHNRACKLAAELSVPYYQTSVKEPALVEQVFHELMRLIIQFRNGVSRDVARRNSTVSTKKPGKKIKRENSQKIGGCAISPCSLL